MDTVSQCLPEPDQFSSCQDLMRNQILRVFMWILGLSAFLGNSFVILWRILPVRRDSKDRRNSVQDVLVLNLAIADKLMGIYMLIIASVDMYYRNVYIVYADEWMSSVLCQLAGSLSVISSEASVCFLTMLSLDRFLGIAFPFSDKKLRRNSAIFTAVSIWCFVGLISFMPFFVKSYFGNHFYGRSSVCLALPLTNDRPPGWFYSIFWFLGFNLICFIAILLCYIGIYIAAKLSASNVGKGSSALTKRQTEQIKMAMKMLFLVGTDFICWMPVIVLGILSTCNIIIISPIVYVCTAVFILPINSSLNPYLYTILTGEIKLKRKRSASNKWKQSGKSTSLVMSNCDSATNHLTTNENSLMKVATSQISKVRLMPPIDKNLIQPFLMSAFLKKGRSHVSSAQMKQIQTDVKRALDYLHTSGLSHGKVDGEHILIDHSGNHLRAFLMLDTHGDTRFLENEETDSHGEPTSGICNGHEWDTGSALCRHNAVKIDIESLEYLVDSTQL
ncbi:G-protein coupled receptor GRL101-like [Amphiura filiformis]|uniref:G-protein coupled receptor GRL101-like n=1 Tax=Amphiura filiformis TaxID=82378 RepID=UPI003B20B8FF